MSGLDHPCIVRLIGVCLGPPLILVSNDFFNKQGSYGSWKTGKWWNFTISFSRSGKYWNLAVGHGKSWKMTVQNELSSYIGIFSCKIKHKQTEIKIMLWKISMEMFKFRSWKTLKSRGKGHGKSWNFNSPKEYEPEPSFASFVTQSKFACVLFFTRFSLIA